jgi:acetyl esterase/lipase
MSQYVRLYLPTQSESTGTRYPLCFLIHGGFFKEKYSIENSAIESIPPFLTCAGIAVALVEYRRVGNGGGYPNTNEDIICAVNKTISVCHAYGIDRTRTAVVGHSAGATLSLWACSHPAITRLTSPPIFCLAIAPICNLIEGQRQQLSDDGDAIEKYVGISCPVGDDDEKLSVYLAASPHAMQLQVQ